MSEIIELTESQKNNFLQDSRFCPICGSNNITQVNSDFNHRSYFDTVTCMDCKTSWTEQYTLVDIFDLKKD